MVCRGQERIFVKPHGWGVRPSVRANSWPQKEVGSCKGVINGPERAGNSQPLFGYAYPCTGGRVPCLDVNKDSGVCGKPFHWQGRHWDTGRAALLNLKYSADSSQRPQTFGTRSKR